MIYGRKTLKIAHVYICIACAAFILAPAAGVRHQRRVMCGEAFYCRLRQLLYASNGCGAAHMHAEICGSLENFPFTFADDLPGWMAIWDVNKFWRNFHLFFLYIRSCAMSLFECVVSRKWKILSFCSKIELSCTFCTVPPKFRLHYVNAAHRMEFSFFFFLQQSTFFKEKVFILMIYRVR